MVESIIMILPHLLLASTSPRRRELIALTGLPVRFSAAGVDETPLPAENPADYVLRLAQSKARACASHAGAEEWVLAADTTVADGRQILGKPQDAAEAAAMLRQLRGRTHQVFTALAVLNPASGRLETDLCASSVPMRNYSDAEIETYVASGDPLDKAGAYAIQNGAFRPVAEFNGCYACVVGLPLCHLQRTLGRMNAIPAGDVPQACQRHLGYTCPIFARVLRGENIG